MSLVYGSEQYSFTENSKFSHLEHIPDEDPTHQVKDHDFVRQDTGRQLHHAFVPRDEDDYRKWHSTWQRSPENKVPNVVDFPAEGVHMNSAGQLAHVWETHDYGPNLAKRVHLEENRRRYQLDAEKDMRVNMTGYVQDQYVTTGPTDKQVLSTKDDKTKGAPRYNHVLYSLGDKGSGESTIMLTGTREVPMPLRFGGPTTQSRGQHRLEKSTMFASKHKDSMMKFRPHNEIVQSNEMHHMIGEREYGTTAYRHLEEDMLQLFEPRNEHTIYDTYHTGYSHDTDFVVSEPGEWM